jgi:hypothetical protein
MSNKEVKENLDQINDLSFETFKPLVQASIKILSGFFFFFSFSKGDAKLDFDGLMNALSPISEKTEIPTRKLAIYVKILTITFQNAIKQVLIFFLFKK